MTMTEPGNQSEETKSLNNPTSQPSGQDSSSEEVNKIVHSVNSGGGSINDGASDRNADNATDPEADDKKGMGRRSVSFPSDEAIVKNCLEPPDPWRNVPAWDSDELVLAYKKSCEKHSAKPLASVLSQIQSLVNNGKRQDLLVLKGEKLDHKHLETLEEIFRRVQFKTLDFEGSHLDDESAVALFDMIEYYDSTCHLIISGNKSIAARGWQACSRLIRRAPALTSLDMRGCDLNERCVPILGRALKLGSPLTVLHLENTYLAGRSLTILVAALKMNETLQELFLADNRLMPSDGVPLGSLLKFNHTLQMLDLRSNHLQDVGVSNLAEGLAEQTSTTGLKTLVLWDNQITYQSMASLGRALGLTECLQTLNLGRNNITNEGIHQLKEGLLKSRSLLRLGLQSTKLSCEGAVALAEYVADSQKLLRLDLRLNDIKTAGMMALSLALRVNESVTRLDLDKEIKRDPGMKDFAEQQMRLLRDVLMHQERNQQRALEREDAARQELEQRAEEEAAKRQAAAQRAEEEAAALAADPLHAESAYIPTVDRIQRPKLLINQHVTPQATLESPIVLFKDPLGAVKDEVPAAVTPLPSASLTPLPLVTYEESDGLLSAPPPADMLLSPQYYPRTTARKIFSVTRCPESTSPTLGVPPTAAVVTGMGGASLTSPMSPTAMPVIPAIDVVSPTSLCQDLALQTVDQYIQLITAETAIPAEKDDETAFPPGEEEGGGDACPAKDSKPSTLSEACADGEGGGVEGEAEASLRGGGGGGETPSNTASSGASADCGVDSSASQTHASLNGTVPTSSSRHSMDIAASELVTEEGDCGQAPGSSQEDSLQNETDDVDESEGDVTELVNGRAAPAPRGEENVSLPSDSGDASMDADGETVLVELADGQEREKGPKMAPQKPEAQVDSGIGSYDNDPWLTVESSDAQPQARGLAVGSPEKPDFFTNLSFNGLTQELASALDSIDLDANSKNVGPDQFEQELNAMVARVQREFQTWPFVSAGATRKNTSANSGSAGAGDSS